MTNVFPNVYSFSQKKSNRKLLNTLTKFKTKLTGKALCQCVFNWTTKHDPLHNMRFLLLPSG